MKMRISQEPLASNIQNFVLECQKWLELFFKIQKYFGKPQDSSI